MSSILDTAEYRKLALIAAGVPLDRIPPILDTATWRHLLIAALLKNAASQVISGSVDYFSELPTTVGSPAIGATYLVRYASGIYYINYRSAGVYMKVTDTGSSSDWVYIPMSAIGTLPDVTLTDLQSGDALVWDGSKWVNQIPPTFSGGYVTVPTGGYVIDTASNIELYELQLNLEWDSVYSIKICLGAYISNDDATLYIYLIDTVSEILATQVIQVIGGRIDGIVPFGFNTPILLGTGFFNNVYQNTFIVNTGSKPPSISQNPTIKTFSFYNNPVGVAPGLILERGFYLVTKLS
jgi:hypothetical protein